ncbi:MAG TPA: hypothetical protein VIS48_08375 [Candidatus Kryptonia bacterium]
MGKDRPEDILVQQQMKSLEDRVTKIEVNWKVTFILAAIFGIGGGFGGYYVSSLYNTIHDLKVQTDSLQAESSHLRTAMHDTLVSVQIEAYKDAPDALRRAVEAQLHVCSARIDDAHERIGRIALVAGKTTKTKYQSGKGDHADPQNLLFMAGLQTSGGNNTNFYKEIKLYIPPEGHGQNK